MLNYMESPFKYQSLTRIKEFVVNTGYSFHFANKRLFKSHQLDNDGLMLLQGLPPSPDNALVELFDIAQLAYSILSKKRFYQEAHGRMLERMYNYCSKYLFKNRTSAEEAASMMTVVTFSNRGWWVGNLGDSWAFYIRNAQVRRLIPDTLEAVLDREHFGLSKRVEPKLISGDFESGDRWVLVPKSVVMALNERRLTDLLIQNSEKSVETIARDIVSEAIDRRRNDSYAAYVIERHVI